MLYTLKLASIRHSEILRNMDTYLIGSLIFISLLGTSYYAGYLEKAKQWVTVRKQRAKLLLSLLENIKDSTSSSSNQPAFIVNDTDRSANIIYNRLGTEYIISVPYNRKFVAAMSQFKVELLRQHKDHVNITQQPGIPYTVTAHDLGGFAIRITNEETKGVHEYNHSTVPMYGEEVIESE